MILDFHFRGEQAKFEEEYPKLIDTAKMYLGDELYADLGQHEGVQLGKHDASYDKLMVKYHTMISTFRDQAKEHHIKIGDLEEEPKDSDSGFKLKEEKTEWIMPLKQRYTASNKQ